MGSLANFDCCSRLQTGKGRKKKIRILITLSDMKNSESESQAKAKTGDDNFQKNSFLIAGIGASAGGIKALQDFFQQVPADSDIAYVVILHLSPDHDSR